MDSSTPSFSVVIPTYNRDVLLRRACASVLAQTWRDFELIVVDDGSTLDTAAVVAEFDDPRVHYLRCEHRGVSATRNAGADAAQGRYLVFLDSDDVALEAWLDRFSEAISSTNADLVVCGMEAVGPDGLTHWRWSPSPGRGLDPSELAAHFEAGQVALRREAFLASGGFSTGLRFGEHTELALRLLFGATPRPEVALVPDVLVRVRPRGSDEDYSDSRAACAAYVLEHHRQWRRQIPQLWASYHAILGVDHARLGQLSEARRHFAAALMAHPRPEHAARLALSLLPAAPSAAWPIPGRRQRAPGEIRDVAPTRGTVLFVAIASGLGGSTRSLATLLGHLKGIRRVVACPSPTPFTEVLDERGVFEERMILPGEELPRVLARASAAITLAAYARRHRADLSAIHANGLSERTLVALAALLSRKPVVVWVHDWNVSPWSRRLSPLLKRIARRTVFAAVSEEAAAMLVSAGIAMPDEVAIVPNPIDVDDVRATHRTPGPTVTVGYIGAPAYYKGFGLLPSLIGRLPPEEVHWVVFSGPESAMSEVWEELRALPARQVEIFGKVTDVREAYARCDIVVCPSLHESFGRVVAEAMANGIAVVASDLPPLRRLLGDNAAGLLVTPGDVEAAAAAIRELAIDADLRESKGRAGVLRVKAYEPESVASKMAELLGVGPPED